MTKNTDYEVTFSYDTGQTSGVKHDSTMVRPLEKEGAQLVSREEDEYGFRTIVMNFPSSLDVLSKKSKEIMEELSKKDVKVSISANKVRPVYSINSDEFSDFTSAQALLLGWAQNHNCDAHIHADRMELIMANQQTANDFKNNVLPQTSLFTNSGVAASIYLDEVREPAIQIDNYSTSKKRGMAA